MFRVALVLGEVKRHAADEPPLRAALAQIGLDAAGMMCRSRFGRACRAPHHQVASTSRLRYSHPAWAVPGELETRGPSRLGGAIGAGVPFCQSAGV